MIAFQLCLDFIWRVVEHEVVAARAAQLPATQSCESLLLRQGPRRNVSLIVERAEDERMVDIPICVHNGDLFANAGQPDLSELVAGCRRHHPDPRRAHLIVVAQPVPVKLQLDPPVAVRVDGGAGRADDDGRVQSRVGSRFAVVVATRTPADVLANAREAIFVTRGCARAGLVIVRYLMVGRQD